MGTIMEPKNVDFNIQSTSWTKDELAMLSAIIKKSKKKKEIRVNKKPTNSAGKKNWA
jgi:hypothetical protein